MKKRLKRNVIQIFAAAIFIVGLSGCSDDENTVNTVLPEANSISGTITFVDTNFITAGGYYDIGVFPNPSVPPAYWFGPPSANDTLVYTRVGATYKATYKLRGVNNGSYVVAVGFRKNTGGQSPIMGVYGCDTLRAQYSNCFLDPQRITISNNLGVENVNFLSWADTTMKIY